MPSKTGHLQTELWPGKPSLRTKAKCLTGASAPSGGKKLGKFIIFQRKGLTMMRRKGFLSVRAKNGSFDLWSFTFELYMSLCLSCGTKHTRASRMPFGSAV